MKLGRLNHIGIAVPDMEAAIRHWREVMGAAAIGQPFAMPEQGVRVCFVDTPNHDEQGGLGGQGGTQIELIEPLGPASPIHGFLARNPGGGQHHLAFEVADIHAARDYFMGAGCRVLGEIRMGAHGVPVFFLHPKDMGGVLTEIMETPRP